MFQRGGDIEGAPTPAFLKGIAIWPATIAACALTLAAQAPANPTLPEVLSAAGAYVAEYEKQISAIASEERYQQTAGIAAIDGVGPRERILRSDFLLIDGESAGWIGVRDVFEVDGRSIRARDDRLVKVVTAAAPDALANARRLAGEGAGYHVGRVNRAINTPTTALVFLRRDNQARSAFTLDGMKAVGRLRVALVVFKEQAVPRVLRTADNAAAEGRLWIEPGSGRVVQTELVLKSAGNGAKISVRYADQPTLGLWLPDRLDEEYETQSIASRGGVAGRPIESRIDGTITGRADYRNFRKIDVEVNRIVR